MASFILPAGTVLDDRFEVEDLLGSGAFGSTYLARDRSRGDRCVLRELSPRGSVRDENLVLHLPDEKLPAALRLRHRFLEEARMAAMVVSSVVLPPREAFVSLGTAWYATDYLPGARTLAAILESERSIPPPEAMRHLDALLAGLAELHSAGTLHRDIRPSNILVASDRIVLIDWGAAREWDLELRGIQVDPDAEPYAAPERLSAAARRGPPTDLYSLCAAYYEAITGSRLPSAAERLRGVPIRRLDASGPLVPEALAATIEFGLRLPYAERPQSAQILRRVLQGDPPLEQADENLEAFDERAQRLQSFRFERRQCPSCGNGILDQPRPLKKRQCPVCGDGTIKERTLDVRACPYCRHSRLDRRKNEWPRCVCPICAIGILAPRKVGLIRKSDILECPECETTFEPSASGWRLAALRGREQPEERRRELEGSEWARQSGRSEWYWLCRGCGAQFDETPAGRRRLAYPPNVMAYTELFPEEWARLAVGLRPEAGNAECEACGSDYFVEGDRVTLVAAERDLYGRGRQLLGRLLDWETLRWLGAGKESPRDGLVCGDCGAEFDLERDFLRLIHADNIRMLDRSGQPRTMEDWHRIAQGLPTRSEEPGFEEDFQAALAEAYAGGKVGFDHPRRPNLVWNGPATKFENDQEAWTETGDGTLTITADEISFGGLLRKTKRATHDLVEIEHQGNRLMLHWEGGDSDAYEIEPIEMSAHLDSGSVATVLDAARLAERLRLEIRSRRDAESEPQAG